MNLFQKLVQYFDGSDLLYLLGNFYLFTPLISKFLQTKNIITQYRSIQVKIFVRWFNQITEYWLKQNLHNQIAKLQRELQSQFDTAAAVMRKFKETKKKHDGKKITQKTSNAEAQPENKQKKTKVSLKAEPTKNIEEKASDKTKSQDQKTTKKLQSSAKVSSKGNLEKERGQITCLRQSCQIIAKSWSK
ncbi:Hypothetical_protein [Hexamita inflata]|uniref:Hypothetical_protein n=1 Tax=Hexamita inflata TaxID=28002 RepID=A0AA86RCV5_9EUKA|nr:Hypothetical protein HINF_LOCUS63231 [Hexamita inflata]